MSRGVMGMHAWVGVLLALGLVLPSGARAAGLLEKEHPLVQKGREAFNAGHYEDALTAFDEAKKERPNDPAVEFNRGDALMKLGRYDEALKSFQQVAESQQPQLRQKATYNQGNAYNALGNKTEALKAYRRALKMDPTDEWARHNAQVLLMNLPPNEKKPDAGTPCPDGGTDCVDGSVPDAGDGGQDGGLDGGQDGGPDGGPDGGLDGGQDGGLDGGPDGGQGDAGMRPCVDGGGDCVDGGWDAGLDGGEDGGAGDGGPGDGGEGEAPGEEGEESDGGTESEVVEVGDAGVTPQELDRQKAERLLDRMKQNEKNLQLWRFQQKKRQRKPNEKDW